MRNKIHFYKRCLYLCVVMLATVSCNDWLDVEPKSQVKDKDLFSSETGFKEALSGVYSIMTQEYLYGKELTFGMLGVLAQSGTINRWFIWMIKIIHTRVFRRKILNRFFVVWVI